MSVGRRMRELVGLTIARRLRFKAISRPPGQTPILKYAFFAKERTKEMQATVQETNRKSVLTLFDMRGNDEAGYRSHFSNLELLRRLRRTHAHTHTSQGVGPHGATPKTPTPRACGSVTSKSWERVRWEEAQKSRLANQALLGKAFGTKKVPPWIQSQRPTTSSGVTALESLGETS